jgi:hypothetical protein
MKRNAIRLEKLEYKLIGNSSDFFRLSDFEILERIGECEFKQGRKPTQKFMDLKQATDKTVPIFSPKVYQRKKEEQAERHVQIEAMNDVELDDHLGKLIMECEMEETFEDMNEQELDKYNKAKKETLC